MKKHLNTVVRKSSKENKSNNKLTLTQNERNLPLPSSFFKEFKDSIVEQDITFYPNLTKLTNKLAKYLDIKPSNIMFTPGSDIGIKLLFEAFDVRGNNVVTTNYHFPMYSVYANLTQCYLKLVEYKSNRMSINDILSAIDDDTKFVLLANPNSPIGDYMKVTDIIKLLKTGIPVIIDEAYIELTDKESVVTLIEDFKNLIVLRTFSKGFGAAGLRVGYIVSNIANMKIINKLRFMYEISGISAKYCEFVLDNIKNYESYLRSTMKGKKDMFKSLSKPSSNVITTGTDSSWFFIRGKKNNDNLHNIFEEQRVSIRTTVLPDGIEWFKLNYDLAIESTNLKTLLINA